MIEEKPSLQEIDFGCFDSKFIFKEQSNQIRCYLGKYFVKLSTSKNSDFIYSFDYSPQAEQICQSKDSLQTVEELLQWLGDIGRIFRCVEYKGTIFCFTDCVSGEYYSFKYECWRWFKWKAPKNIQMNELLEISNDFFINQAKTVKQKKMPFVVGNILFDTCIEGNIPFDTHKVNNQDTEFVCGSQSELERLTKLTAFALPELASLFKEYSNLKFTYESENDYNYGGFAKIETGSPLCYTYSTISKQARKLLDLIFEYNLFTGLNWEYTDGIPVHTSYIPLSRTIEVEVQVPSQHEKLEAAFELQNWLKGKLPEEEIKSYFD